MNTYTVFQSSTGEILRTVTLATNLPIKSQLARDEDYILESAKTGQYVFGKLLVDMPLKPSRSHMFNWQTKQWEDPRTLQDHINETRRLRNTLLLACDWTQLPDVPEATQLIWGTYRQGLRDVTDQPDQMNVVWPVKPV